MKVNRVVSIVSPMLAFLVASLMLAFLVAPLAMPDLARAADVQVMQVKDKTADAFFSSIDSTGCIQTDVFVVLSEHREKTQPDGIKIFVPSATMFAVVTDICRSVRLRDAVGSTEQLTYDFSGNLDSARVLAVITVVDRVCNSCVYDVAVDLTWTGQGDITTSRERDTMTSPGMTVVTRFKGSFRSAETAGTVNIVGSSDNLTPPGSQVVATLQQVQTGSVTIIRD